MKDPYETLGLVKTATDAQIKAAFKKLARKHHPDLRPDDKAAVVRFKEITAAHDLLKDPESRRRFDAGEIDGTGAERPQQPFYRDQAQRSGHAAQDGFPDAAAMEEFLARAFAGRSGGSRHVRHRTALLNLRPSRSQSAGFREAATLASRTTIVH